LVPVEEWETAEAVVEITVVVIVLGEIVSVQNAGQNYLINKEYLALN
jgi:hypothetical protein